MLKDIQKIYKEAKSKKNETDAELLRIRMETIKVGLFEKIKTAAEKLENFIDVFPGETYNEISIKKDDLSPICEMLKKEKFTCHSMGNASIKVYGWGE